MDKNQQQTSQIQKHQRIKWQVQKRLQQLAFQLKCFTTVHKLSVCSCKTTLLLTLPSSRSTVSQCVALQIHRGYRLVNTRQVTIPLSVSASPTWPALHADTDLPTVGNADPDLPTLSIVDTELSENIDISDDVLLTLLKEASASSWHPSPVLLSLVLRRWFLRAGLSCAGWQLTAAFNFCSQCRLSSSSLATNVYEWRGFARDDTQNVLLPVNTTHAATLTIKQLLNPWCALYLMIFTRWTKK